MPEITVLFTMLDYILCLSSSSQHYSALSRRRKCLWIWSSLLSGPAFEPENQPEESSIWDPSLGKGVLTKQLVKRGQPLTLWRQPLLCVKEKFLFKEDVCNPRRWITMEKMHLVLVGISHPQDNLSWPGLWLVIQRSKWSQGHIWSMLQ